MSAIDRAGRQAGEFGLAALLGGMAWLVLAGVQATNPTFDDVLGPPIDYINDATFAVALICTAVGVIGLARVGVAPSAAAGLVATGYLLVAVGVAAGLALGKSPEWFVVVGLPGNLLALIGMVWLGVAILRRRTLPTWAGALAIPAGLFAVVGSEVGSSAVAGVFWVYVGARLLSLGRGSLSLS